ncbi:CTP synthetase [Pseudooceanicola sp.]|uniref:CTP synthetase n=1 Tax=Pseudooceanicola sp. TaxID=1914328 RepID=UPI0035C69C59
MLRLASILYSLIGTTLAGSAVIVALVSGQDRLWPIVIGAALGFLAALPVTYLVAKKIYSA